MSGSGSAPAVQQAVYTASGKYAHAAFIKHLPKLTKGKLPRRTQWRTYCGNLGWEPSAFDDRPYSWAEVEPAMRCRKCIATQEHRSQTA